MKLLYQTLIIIFVFLSLYLIRGDIKTIYDYIYHNIKSPAAVIKDNITIKSDKVSTLLNAINTPGALHPKDGLVSDTSKVNLSIKDVVAWTNKNRKINGDLAPLQENSKLDFSAQMKLSDMFNQQYFEHISPDGTGVQNLGEKVSYEYIIIGENLALGNFKDAESLLNAWMVSPGHRANILNKNYADIGVAVGHGMFKGQDTWIAVQHFGLPRSACPAINEVLHGKIILDQKQATTMENNLTLRKARIDSGAVYGGKTTDEQIQEYNDLVLNFNKFILGLKEETSEYNTYVRAFNSCIPKDRATN